MPRNGEAEPRPGRAAPPSSSPGRQLSVRAAGEHCSELANRSRARGRQGAPPARATSGVRAAARVRRAGTAQHNRALFGACAGTGERKTAFQFQQWRHEMDQRPNDRIRPRPDEPLSDDIVDRPTRTNWDRVTRTEEGAWNYIPLLLVAALIAIGAWLLMAADRTGTPAPKTTENVPNATAPARPTPNPSATPQPTTPAPSPPATKP